MGHLRLKRLPKSRGWKPAAALLASGADVGDVTTKSAKAAENARQAEHRDPVFADVVWLLTQIPLAVRAPDFSDAAKVFELAEHALDGVAVAVEVWRESDFPAPVLLWRFWRDVWQGAFPSTWRRMALLSYPLSPYRMIKSGTCSKIMDPAVQAAT